MSKNIFFLFALLLLPLYSVGQINTFKSFSYNCGDNKDDGTIAWSQKVAKNDIITVDLQKNTIKLFISTDGSVETFNIFFHGGLVKDDEGNSLFPYKCVDSKGKKVEFTYFLSSDKKDQAMLMEYITFSCMWEVNGVKN